MVITAILSTLAFILFMFIGLRVMTRGKTNQIEKSISGTSVASEPIQKKQTIGRIESIKSNQLLVFDLTESRYIEVVPTKVTQIKDLYGKEVPLGILKTGDLVEVTYDVEKDLVLSISKEGVAWIKTNVEKMDIDASQRKLYLSNESYVYTLDTMVLDENEEKNNIYYLGKYDTLELIGIGDTVHTIRVVKKQGQIQLTNIPLLDGLIEINTSRQINLQNATGPIPVGAGRHKLVIKMKGYETLMKEVVVEEGKTIEVDLQEVSLAYTEILLEVQNNIESYKVEIDGNTYYKGEPVKARQGVRRIKVSADGYVDWLGDVTLKEEIIRLKITLQVKEAELKEETSQEQNTTNPNTQVDTQNTSSNTGVGNVHTVNISTDPEGATIYINGENKGTTPYRANLNVGAYTIRIQKEGYDDYTSSIIIDNSDDQNSHLYILNPR